MMVDLRRPKTRRLFKNSYKTVIKSKKYPETTVRVEYPCKVPLQIKKIGTKEVKRLSLLVVFQGSFQSDKLQRV